MMACSDEEGNLSIIHTDTKERIAHTRHNDSIFDTQFSESGTQLLMASADEFAYVRDIHHNIDTVLHCLGHHRGTLKTARWNSDSTMCVTAARDGDIALWDMRMASSNARFTSPASILSGIHQKASSVKGKKVERTSVIQAEFLQNNEHLIASIGQPDKYKKMFII